MLACLPVPAIHLNRTSFIVIDNGDTDLNFQQILAASNASVTIDDLEIENTTNTLTDNISGVTVDLLGEGDATIAVETNKVAIKDKLNQFVDTFNGLLGYLNSQLKVQEGGNRSKSLAGDSTIRMLKSDLVNTMINTINNAEGTFDAASQMGISFTRTGTLQLNESDLDDAMAKDLNSVGQLFALEDDGLSTVLSERLELYTDSLDGMIVERTKAMNNQIDRIDDQVMTLEQRGR